MQDVIAVRDISKNFMDNEVIKNCRLTIPQGMIYGLLGVNGAGKTTFFKLLIGLLQPTCGCIEILGSDMLLKRDTLLSQIGSLIEVPIFYEHLSARKNLELHLAYMNTSGMGVDNVLQLTGLSGVGEKAVKSFSLGMRQRLGIARAIIHRPKLLILDEPINGLDPIGIKQMRDLFVKLVKEDDMTILVSSHILNEIEQVADRVGIITDGKILYETDIKDLKEHDQSNLEEYFYKLMSGGKEK